MFECQEQVAPEKALGDATVCLHIYESPKTQLGESLPFHPNLGKPPTQAFCLMTEFLNLSIVLVFNFPLQVTSKVL